MRPTVHVRPLLFALAVVPTAVLAQDPPPAAGAAGEPDIRGLHEAITLPPAPQSTSPLVWLALAAALLAAVALFAYRRRSRQAPEPSPEHRVRAAFAAACRAMETGMPAHAAAVLEGAVRDYLHARFEVPAEARTTTEIARLLVVIDVARQPLLAEFANRLIRLLHVCDEAAFGRAPIAASEWNAIVTGVHELVDRREAWSECAVAPERLADDPRAAVAVPSPRRTMKTTEMSR